MIVVVTGSRNWTGRMAMWLRLVELPPRTVVIHGACRGADMMAHSYAKLLKLRPLPIPADWETYGSSAGHIRNCLMLGAKPELVLAFHENLAESRGTKDCVEEAQRRGIPVEIIT